MTNNRKLFQILYLKKITESDYLLPKIIKFKKYYMDPEENCFIKNKKIIYEKFSTEYIIWIDKFFKYDSIFFMNINIGEYINLFDKAVEDGNLDSLKWLRFNRPEFNKKIMTWSMDIAAGNGHLKVIKWLHKNMEKNYECCTTQAMDKAARNGHLDVVIWLHENMSKGCTTYAMDWAAMNGHLDIVKWLHENRREGCSKKLIVWIVLDRDIETNNTDPMYEYLKSIGK